MQNILITGGSGFIGRKLTSMLSENGFHVAWLSRSKKVQTQAKIFLWDVDSEYMEEGVIQWADAIIHLAGESIAAKRWTKKRKQQIIHSRIKSTALLRKCLDTTGKKMQVIISASAIGYYGNRKNEVLLETSQAGEGFLSESCVAWEQATAELSAYAERCITFRVGIVLDKSGGALKELTKTIPFGFAPVLGNGKQVYSWVMLADVCRMIMFALENRNLLGAYNCVAPHPVTQKELIKKILLLYKRKVLLFPVPAVVLKIVLGEMANTVLINQNVSCKKILETGFWFQTETL